MIQINKDSLQITIQESAPDEVYDNYVRALIHLLQNQNPETQNEKFNFFALKLIENMLPEHLQARKLQSK